MLLMETSHIKKYFGDRLIINAESIKIYSKDRIGIVGVNGTGKTTLMNMLCQRTKPDDGWVKSHVEHSYISQLEEPEVKYIDGKIASKLGIKSNWDDNMSGGEKTRFKFGQSLSENNPILFADEPTSNVDMEGIELMESMFKEFPGALVLISHDRSLLDNLCNKIWALEKGEIKVYQGNYEDYQIQKKKEIERKKFEYQQYIHEKKRLENVKDSTKKKMGGIKRTPKRMGNSEARLHKMGGQKAKANLDKAVKSIESRIEHLEVKEKPRKEDVIKLDLLDSEKLHSKIIVEGMINKSFGERIIFKDAEIKIYNGSKTALIGPNGCGKSTLIKMIMDGDEGIKIAPKAKIGYFNQDLSILNPEGSIIENVMEGSVYPQDFARLLLARLLFRGEDVYKKINVLSGGERVKVSFVKILLQDINILILDEPTNYMDINSLEVIEEALREYDRTVLFVSHDRKFVDSVADHIIRIEHHKIKLFEGSYQKYLESKSKSTDKKKMKEEVILLENRLSEIMGRLSMPSKQDDRSKLDQEYHTIIEELKKIKKRITD